MGLESYDRGLVDVVRVLGNHDACDTEADRPSEVKEGQVSCKNLTQLVNPRTQLCFGRPVRGFRHCR